MKKHQKTPVKTASPENEEIQTRRDGLHCDLCRCPIEIWQPYKDYPSDRSCELFYLLEHLIAGEKGKPFTIGGFLEKHGEQIEKEFPDLKNLNGVLWQHIEQQIDIGDMKHAYDIYYVAPVYNRDFRRADPRDSGIEQQ